MVRVPLPCCTQPPPRRSPPSSSSSDSDSPPSSSPPSLARRRTGCRAAAAAMGRGAGPARPSPRSARAIVFAGIVRSAFSAESTSRVFTPALRRFSRSARAPPRASVTASAASDAGARAAHAGSPRTSRRSEARPASPARSPARVPVPWVSQPAPFRRMPLVRLPAHRRRLDAALALVEGHVRARVPWPLLPRPRHTAVSTKRPSTRHLRGLHRLMDVLRRPRA